MNDDCWKVDDTHHLPGREGGFDKPLTCEIPGIPSVFQLIVNVLMLPHTFAPCFKIMIGVKLQSIKKRPLLSNRKRRLVFSCLGTDFRFQSNGHVSAKNTWVARSQLLLLLSLQHTSVLPIKNRVYQVDSEIKHFRTMFCFQALLLSNRKRRLVFSCLGTDFRFQSNGHVSAKNTWVARSQLLLLLSLQHTSVLPIKNRVYQVDSEIKHFRTMFCFQDSERQLPDERKATTRLSRRNVAPHFLPDITRTGSINSGSNIGQLLIGYTGSDHKQKEAVAPLL